MSPFRDAARDTFVPLAFRRRGVQKVLNHAHPVPDATLIEGLGRAFYWQHLIDIGHMGSGADIARAEGLDQSWVNVLLRLSLLAPDIVERILTGTQPRTLCLWWFQRHLPPADWVAQRAVAARFEEAP